MDYAYNYVIVKSVFSKNCFAFDGKFPYPSSSFPMILVDLKNINSGDIQSYTPANITYYFDITVARNK